MSDIPWEGEVWKHFKGRAYLILGRGLDANNDRNLEQTVIYRSDEGTWYTRKLSEFTEEVSPGVPRFVRVR